VAVLSYSSLQQGLLSGKYTDPAEVSEGRRRTRLFNPDSSPKTQHGSPGLQDAVFGRSASSTGPPAAYRTAAAGPPSENHRFCDTLNHGAGALSALREVCAAEGVGMVDAAIGWLLAQGGVACVLGGASTPEQVLRNSKLPQLSPRVIDALAGATAGLKQALVESGNTVDQYARESRIHGNEVPFFGGCE
jgi:aryl-alcohol dehydrogenase-like predicted oxidoreductase